MNELLEKIKFYKEGRINWLELAPDLCKAEQDNIDMNELPLDSRRSREMIKSYRFLQIQRPDYLKNPQPLITARMISSLPLIYSNMGGPNKEEVFQKIIDRVLRGEIVSEKLRKIIHEYKSGQRPEIIPEKKNGPVRALSDALSLVDYILDTILKNMSYDELREELGDKCHDTATKLSCVADEGFRKLWNERRKGRV